MTQDQAFLDALQELRNRQPSIDHWRIKINHLLENSIQSLDALYALVDDPNADESLRADGCTIIGSLCKSRYDRGESIVDERRAEPIILRALASPSQEIAKSALWTLARLNTKRGNKTIVDIAFDPSNPRGLREDALQHMGLVGTNDDIEPLLAILRDRTENEWARKMALISVATIPMPTQKETESGRYVASVFYDLIRDESESISLRGDAIEQLASLANTAYLPFFIELLRHEEPEIRFWASYSIVCNTNKYGLDVVPEIDRAIRHDVGIPDGLWSIGREVLPAMEEIVYRHLVPDTEWSLHRVFISPEPEYWTYMNASRVGDTGQEWKVVPKTTTLKIDPAWLEGQIKAQWEDANFNNREPAPESHLLTWQITLGENVLIGGLLFDGYAIILTSKYNNDLINTFAAWYRTIISPEHALYSYGWADEGILL